MESLSYAYGMVRKMQFSTEQVQEAVRRYGAGASLVELSVYLGCSRPTVKGLLEAQGVEIISKPRQKSQTSPEMEVEVIKMYQGGSSLADIKSHASISDHTVYNILERAGLKAARVATSESNIDVKKWTPELRSQVIALVAEHRSVDEMVSATGLSEYAIKKFTAYGQKSPFSNIDNEAAAYWLGFITADGCITGDTSANVALTVGLAAKDRAHLLKLSEFLDSTRDLYDYEISSFGTDPRPVSRFTSQDRAVVMDLIRHGVTPRKTGNEKPWDGPEHLMRHYWRGMIDGDGSVYSEKAKYPVVALVGSFETTASFSGWFNELLGTNVHPTPDRRSPNHWHVNAFGTRSAKNLVIALYGDATIVLDRKFDRAREIMSAV